MVFSNTQPAHFAAQLPFVLLRKAGKNPGPLVESSAYSKEYEEAQPDRMCIRLGAVVKEDRVLLIDDLIATGGTIVFRNKATVERYISHKSLPGLLRYFRNGHIRL